MSDDTHLPILSSPIPDVNLNKNQESELISTQIHLSTKNPEDNEQTATAINTTAISTTGKQNENLMHQLQHRLAESENEVQVLLKKIARMEEDADVRIDLFFIFYINEFTYLSLLISVA